MTRGGERRVAVIGLGNLLLGDDGFGPVVVERLRRDRSLPSDVRLIDAGTPGLDLADYLHGNDLVILVDAVRSGSAPGSLRCLADDELDALPMEPRVSPHDPAVREAVWIANLDGNGPSSVLLLGVEPENVDVGTELSPSVAGAVDAAAAWIVDACRAFSPSREIRQPN